MQDKMSELNAHVAVLHQRLDHLDECLDEFKDDVLGGHGKPGELPGIKQRMDAVEKMLYKALGAMVGVILLSGFLSGSGLLSLAKAVEYIYGK